MQLIKVLSNPNKSINSNWLIHVLATYHVKRNIARPHILRAALLHDLSFVLITLITSTVMRNPRLRAVENVRE